ncbi:hypothetical protein A9Q73_10495 [Bermanella sp. 47_1433_sub80_T6]|nr:hypothetical protein A9Q73_10495 [Bermanella sp. 47_1433_sub80_T6]
MLAKIFKRYRLTMIICVGLMTGLLSACGSSDDDDDNNVLTSSDASKIYVSQIGAVTVSGVVIDAVKRTLISGATVNMRIDGHIYTVVSAPSTHASPGSFSFLKADAESEFFITVSTSDSSYAPYFYANETPRASNTNDGIETQDIGSVALYKPVTTSITIKDISGGTAISGLSLYYDTQALAQVNSGTTVSISGNDVVATESTSTTDDVTTGTGVYSFALPNDGTNFTIKINELLDSNSVQYKGYNSAITDNVITTLSAGGDKSFYMTKTDTQNYTIFIHLVDDEGHAYDAGESIVLTKTGDPVAIFAERKTATTNEYVLTTTFASLDFTVLNMDLDGDGFPDTATAQLTALGGESTNVLGNGAFNASREATVTVPITMISSDQNIAAELLSGSDQFQVNGISEVIFAFDRPVDIVHEVRMFTKALNTKTTTRAMVVTPSIFETDKTTAATLTGGGVATLNANNTQYDYNNDASVAQVSGVISNNDGNGNVTSPYEVDFDSANSVTVIPSTSYAFTANNTVLTITLDSSTLASDQSYTFELAVKGQLADTPIAFLSKTLVAKSNATITQLSDLWLDNMDFLDTTSKNLAVPAAEQNFTNQSSHISRFEPLPLATYDGTNIPQIEYLTYGLSLAAYNSYPTGNVYLISKARLTGTVEIVSETETYLDSAGAVDTEVRNNVNTIHGLEYSSASNITTGDTDLTALVSNIQSDTKYLLDVPSNHGVRTTGLTTVYSTLETTINGAGSFTVATSGAGISTEGIYYLYEIPLSTPTLTSGYISSAVLNLNISVNGVSFSGSETFNVK